MGPDKLTTRQAILWFTMHQIGTAFLVLPRHLYAIAKQDAWIALTVGLGIQLLVILIYMAIANQINGKSMVQHMKLLFGSPFGNSLLLLFILGVPLLLQFIALRDLGDFVNNSITPETPMEFICFLMLIPIYYAVRTGIGTIGRTAEFFFIFFIALFVIVIITLAPSIQIDNLLPVLEEGWKPVFHASLIYISFPYMDNILFLFLIPYYTEPQKLKKIFLTSTLISGIMFILMIAAVAAVLSESVAAHLTYPSYFVVRTISIIDFIERFEILVTIFWYITVFYRLALLLFVTNHVLVEMFKLRVEYALLIPLLLLTFAGMTLVWPNTAAQINVAKNWYIYGLSYGLIFPFILWCMGKLRALPRS